MSSQFEIALHDWLQFLHEFGVDLKPQLLPGASEDQIIAVEHTLGKVMPEDWKSLYRLADGQVDPHESPDFASTHTNLFGNYEFLSLASAAMNYEGVRSVAEEAAADPWLNQCLDIRDGDLIRPVAASLGWWPLAGCGPDFIAIDLDPASDGTYGQVISIELAGPNRRVLAPSILSLLQNAVTKLDKNEKHRFTIDTGVANGREYRSLIFDIDWRAKPFY